MRRACPSPSPPVAWSTSRRKTKNRPWCEPLKDAAHPSTDRDHCSPPLTFRYGRTAKVLHIEKRSPYPEQESEELGDDVIARLNPTTDEVENLEILFFSTRLLRSDVVELPLEADLRLVANA